MTDPITVKFVRTAHDLVQDILAYRQELHLDPPALSIEASPAPERLSA